MKNLRTSTRKKWIFYISGIIFLYVSLPRFLFSIYNTQLFAKIDVYLREHYCLRINFLAPHKASCLLNKKVLNQKIKAGLPLWAREQIREDLSHYKTIKRSELDAYQKQYGASLYPLKIKDGKWIDFKKDSLYSHVCYTVPFIFMDDIFRPTTKPPVPVFVFAKDLDHPFEKQLILVPDWMNIEFLPKRASIKQAAKEWPWNVKEPKMFWRGMDTAPIRGQLVHWSSEHPDLIDAQFSSEKTPYVSPEAHLQYRYLASIDGIGCTWTRLVWHLYSNSLTFKNDSHQVQWFYKGIRPYEHYIPFSDKASLLSGIQWSEQHPEETQLIIKRANAFVEENLSLEDIYHYYIVLLNDYAKKFSE